MTINFICGVLAELFDSPCNFSPMDEYMFQDEYCEHHCGEVEDKDCWKRYFEKRWEDSKMSEIPTSSEKPNNCENEPQTDVVALDKATLMDYFINSVDENDEPVWTERHIDEILKDFDVVPKTEPQKIGYCNECKWFRDKQVCGRCRSKNLYTPKDEPQIIACPIQEEDADYARWLYEPQTERSE